MEKKLTLDALGDLDQGRVRLLVDEQITRAVDDLDKFGSDEKVRRVVIQIDMAAEDDVPSFRVKCQAKLPPRESGLTLGSLRAAAGGAYALFDALAEGEVS
jgi:hypothetical protein